MPDIMGLAKGLGGGFPVGAVLMTNKVAKGMVAGTHGSTLGGNQLACSVALAVVNEVSKKSFLSKVHAKGSYLKDELGKIKKDFCLKVCSACFDATGTIKLYNFSIFFHCIKS